MKRIFTLVMLIVLIFTITGCKSFGINNVSKHLVSEAQYPENDADKSKKHSENIERQLSFHHDDLNINEFIKNSTADILSGEENKVYSPLNVYIALSMLAETTDGNTRRQITDVLGVDSIEKLRDNVKRLWNSTYSDDEILTTILANSLWLSDGIDYNKGTLDTLANNYYASSYSGVMGDKEYASELKNWIDEQTNGFLSEKKDEIEMNEQTILALISTIYYRGVWNKRFNESDTHTDVFNGAKNQSDVDYMKLTEQMEYFYSEGFSAVKKEFIGNNSMYFVLPDKDVQISEIFKDNTVYDFIACPEDFSKSEKRKVTFSVPKFDISCNIDMKEHIRQLGMTDILNSSTADFSPLSDNANGVCLSSSKHSARIKIDEQGCEAAATFEDYITQGADMSEPVEFTLDRPFIFVITSQTGIPLFIGTINQL